MWWLVTSGKLLVFQKETNIYVYSAMFDITPEIRSCIVTTQHPLTFNNNFNHSNLQQLQVLTTKLAPEWGVTRESIVFDCQDPTTEIAPAKGRCSGEYSLWLPRSRSLVFPQFRRTSSIKPYYPIINPFITSSKYIGINVVYYFPHFPFFLRWQSLLSVS